MTAPSGASSATSSAVASVAPAEIRITVAVRSPFLPFAGGEILDRRSDGDVNRVRTRLEAPMEMAVVVAGKYQTVTEEQGGARVHISSYAAVK